MGSESLIRRDKTDKAVSKQQINDSDPIDRRWRAELDEVRHAGRWRSRQVLESAQSIQVHLSGREYLSFCSNDYLGLANDPRLIEAATSALNDYGFGAGASHLVSGHHALHHQLEEKLAAFTGRERALVFSSGYMANLAVLSTLAGEGDLVLSDRLNHASLLDGVKLSGARAQRFLHSDMQSLQQKFSRFAKSDSGQRFVATDGIFSMDGDIAPLDQIVRICSQQSACLIVDDAHGFGVIGPQGRGSVAHFGLSQSDVPVLIGTFGKAFGTSGAFVAGSVALIELLIQRARPYIYTTAMPPANAAATLEALTLVEAADDKRAHLQGLIHGFRCACQDMGLTLVASNTPIQPIIIGSNEATLKVSAFLRDQGILVVAIRPPTVPENSARLRIALSAAHSQQQVACLISALAEAKRQGLLV